MSEVGTSVRNHSSDYAHIFVIDDSTRLSSLDDREYVFPGGNRGVASYQRCPLKEQNFRHLGLHSPSPLPLEHGISYEL